MEATENIDLLKISISGVPNTTFKFSHAAELIKGNSRSFSVKQRSCTGSN